MYSIGILYHHRAESALDLEAKERLPEGKRLVQDPYDGYWEARDLVDYKFRKVS